MEPLILQGTKVCPEVVLDPVEKIFKLSGRSYPEDVTSFYEPVLGWMREYVKNPIDQTVFDIMLDYFNTASSKVMLDIFDHIEDMSKNGHLVQVRWHYSDDDEDMEEAGREYADIVQVPFEMIEVKGPVFAEPID
jgi:hypothetical protein